MRWIGPCPTRVRGSPAVNRDPESSLQVRPGGARGKGLEPADPALPLAARPRALYFVRVLSIMPCLSSGGTVSHAPWLTAQAPAHAQRLLWRLDRDEKRASTDSRPTRPHGRVPTRTGTHTDGCSAALVPGLGTVMLRGQARRDDTIRKKLMHQSHQLAFGFWKDSQGVVKSCGLKVPNREETVLKLLETMQRAPSSTAPAKFMAPEDAFWGSKLQKKQLVQLCRVLNFPYLKKVLLQCFPLPPECFSLA